MNKKKTAKGSVSMSTNNPKVKIQLILSFVGMNLLEICT